MSHSIFNVVAEDPQVKHVSAKMHPAAVEKHGGEGRQRRIDPTKAGGQLGVIKNHRRNHAQRVKRCLLPRPQ